jgi:hypothetical protein
LIRIIAKRYAKALVQLAEETKLSIRPGLIWTPLSAPKPCRRCEVFASPVMTPIRNRSSVGRKLGMQRITLFVEHLAKTEESDTSGRARGAPDLAQRRRAAVRLTSGVHQQRRPADIKKKLEALR